MATIACSEHVLENVLEHEAVLSHIPGIRVPWKATDSKLPALPQQAVQLFMHFTCHMVPNP